VLLLFAADVLDGISPAPFDGSRPLSSGGSDGRSVEGRAPDRDGHGPVAPDAEALCAHSTIDGKVVLAFDSVAHALVLIPGDERPSNGFLTPPFRPPRPAL
jgi:hypothetical protein